MDPPSVAGWWRCCQCGRDVDPGFYGEDCPDCGHGECWNCGDDRHNLYPGGGSIETEAIDNTGSYLNSQSPPSSSQISIPNWDEEIIRPHPISRNQLLPVLLNFKVAKNVYADTGSQINCISEAYARFLDVRVVPKAQVFKLPIRGLRMESVGAADIRCRFPDPPFMPHTYHFFVFAALACDAILGNKFLKDTQTLDLFPTRLKNAQDHPDSQLIRPSVKFLGSPQERISCWLEDLPHWALPDTGASINLISPELASELGYNNRPGGKSVDNHHNIMVELADGSDHITAGCISITVTFRDPSKHPQSTPVSTFTLVDEHGKSKSRSRSAILGPLVRIREVFYLLDSLEPDVILGDPLLNAVGAYHQHSTNFKYMNVAGPSPIAWGCKKKKGEQKGPVASPRTDVEVLGDEFSVVSDELEQERSSIQLRFENGELGELAKERLGIQAERKYNDWLRANRERVERHWGPEWYLSRMPHEMG